MFTVSRIGAALMLVVYNWVVVDVYETEVICGSKQGMVLIHTNSVDVCAIFSDRMNSNHIPTQLDS